MKKKLCLFIFIYTGVLLFAGTPPVAKLEVTEGLSTNNVFIISVGVPVNKVVISAFNDQDQSVIPSDWYVEPPLPEGLELTRDEFQKNFLLFSGIVLEEVPQKKYSVYAMNNGNKVKSIPPAKIEIEITAKKFPKLGFATSTSFKICDGFDSKELADYPSDGSLISVTATDNGFAYHNSGAIDHVAFMDFSGNLIDKIYTERVPQAQITFFDNHIFVLSNKQHSILIERIHPQSKAVRKKEYIISGGLRSILEIISFDKYIVGKVEFEDTLKWFIFDIEFDRFQFLDADTSASVFATIPNRFIANNGNNLEMWKPFAKEKTVVSHPFLNFATSSCVTTGNGCLFVDVEKPTLGGYLIAKIKDGILQTTFDYGDVRPTSLTYGNGLLVAINKTQVKVYDAETKEVLYQISDKFSSFKKAYFANNHFLIVDYNHGTIWNLNSANIRIKEYQPIVQTFNIIQDFAIEAVPPKEFFSVHDEGIDLIQEGNYEKIASFKGQDIICTKKHFLIKENQVCKIYNIQNKQLEETFVYNSEILEVIANDNHFVIKTEKTVEIIDSNIYRHPAPFSTNAETKIYITDNHVMISERDFNTTYYKFLDIQNLQEVFRFKGSIQAKKIASCGDSIAYYLYVDVEHKTKLYVTNLINGITTELGAFKEEYDLIFANKETLIVCAQNLWKYNVVTKESKQTEFLGSGHFTYGNGYIYGCFERRDAVKIYDIVDLKMQSLVPISIPYESVFFHNTTYVSERKSNTYSLINSSSQTQQGTIKLGNKLVFPR